MTHIIIAVTGCTLLFSGIIGLNLLLSGAMVRDVYLNGLILHCLVQSLYAYRKEGRQLN